MHQQCTLCSLGFERSLHKNSYNEKQIIFTCEPIFCWLFTVKRFTETMPTSVIFTMPSAHENMDYVRYTLQ